MRADSAGAKTWLLGAIAAWALCAWVLALFGLGTLVMRGAGCTYNDIVDRDFDAAVAQACCDERERFVDRLADGRRSHRLMRLVREDLELAGQAPEAVHQLADSGEIAFRVLQAPAVDQQHGVVR